MARKSKRRPPRSESEPAEVSPLAVRFAAMRPVRFGPKDGDGAGQELQRILATLHQADGAMSPAGDGESASPSSAGAPLAGGSDASAGATPVSEGLTREDTQPAEAERLQVQFDELKKSQEALLEERQRYRDLFEFAPEAYLVTDVNGVIREANHAAAELLARPWRFLIGKPLPGLVAIKERRDFRTQLNLLPRNFRGEWVSRLLRDGRGTVEVAFAAFAMFDTHGNAASVRWLLRQVESPGGANAPPANTESAKVEIRVRERTASLHSLNSSLRQELETRELTQQELQNSNRILQLRIQERMSELVDVNLAMKQEMGRRIRTEEEHRYLMRRLVTAQEEERTRIARELHDELGQDLTGLTLMLKALEAVCDGQDSTMNKIAEMREALDGLMQRAHHMARALRPAILDNFALQQALEIYLEEWANRTSIPADYNCSGFDDERLAPELEVTVFRVVQESLTNITRHARARNVTVVLEKQRRQLVVIIADDGDGFDSSTLDLAAGLGSRLGLRGMYERVALVSGTLEINSTPGAGTTVFVHIPLTVDAEDTFGTQFAWPERMTSASPSQGDRNGKVTRLSG